MGPYYTRHLKGKKIPQKRIQNLQGGIGTLLSSSESSYAYCKDRHNNKLLQFSVFWEQCGHKGGNAQLGSNGSEKVWQRDNQLILAEWMLFSCRLVETCPLSIVSLLSFYTISYKYILCHVTVECIEILLLIRTGISLPRVMAIYQHFNTPLQCFLTSSK